MERNIKKKQLAKDTWPKNDDKQGKRGVVVQIMILKEYIQNCFKVRTHKMNLLNNSITVDGVTIDQITPPHTGSAKEYLISYRPRN